jgi:peptide deformylase
MKLVQASNDQDQILTTPTEKVEDFNLAPAIELKLRTAIRMNVDKDGNYNLVGLAANQLGIKKAVTVILIGHESEKLQWLTMVNPEITSSSRETETMSEGCGSLREPEELFFDVERPVEVGILFDDVEGNRMGIKLDHFSARVAQHEIDHLNGILISQIGVLSDSTEEE